MDRSFSYKILIKILKIFIIIYTLILPCRVDLVYFKFVHLSAQFGNPYSSSSIMAYSLRVEFAV